MDKLAEIMAWKRQDIIERTRSIADSEWDAVRAISRPSFYDALARKDHVSVIAEIKRKSPSAGDIAIAASSTEQAARYVDGKTDAISVLTDEKYFGGTLADLEGVTQLISGKQSSVACIRKDFFVDPIQVLEAAQAGASAILIIVRALAEDEMKTLFETANAAGLDSLFEVHEASEIERAVNIGARIMGVNNRDLKRFTTNLAITESVLPQIPDDCVKISESGIFTAGDVARVKAVGADAVLIGEALMKHSDPAQLLREIHAV